MKLSDMIPVEQEIEHARQNDPGFRKLWDETALGREVALKIVRYRADNNLTQAQFAKMLGMTQPAIARLESGDENPTLKTLARVSVATGLTFHVEVAPKGIELAPA